MKKKEPTLKFTNVRHDFRRQHSLSCDEYTLCDMIFFLCREYSEVPGWCYKSKENLAQEIGVSKQGVLNMIERMIQQGFLVRNEQTRYLKTTEKWEQVYFEEKPDCTDSQQSLPTVQKQTAGNKVDPDQSTKLTPDSQQSLPHNNTNKNIDTTDVDDAGAGEAQIIKLFENKAFKTWKIADFKKMCDYLKGRRLRDGNTYSIQEMDDFFRVWTQVDGHGYYKYTTARQWSWEKKLEGYRQQQQIIEQRNKNYGTTKDRSGTTQSGVATKLGTSEARTSGIEDRLRRAEALRREDQAGNMPAA